MNTVQQEAVQRRAARLIIIGAGGHANVVADAAESCGRWRDIVLYDDAPDAFSRGPWRIAGTIADFFRDEARGVEVVVAIGENRRRLELLGQLMERGYMLAVVVHPRATVSRYASIGPGSVVFANAVVNIAAEVGRGSIINTGATVDHDCRLGEAVHVSPGANLAGKVSVGDGSWIGIGACVREGIAIGRYAIVGAGAVVIRPLPDNTVAVGNPARLLPRNAC